jgi:hypothetical protein
MSDLDLTAILPERKPWDHRDDLTRLIRQRDNALRSLNEIATAAQEVIDAYPDKLTPWESDEITPMDNLLMKVAVWESVDDSAPIVFTDPDTGNQYITLEAYGESEATS